MIRKAVFYIGLSLFLLSFRSNSNLPENFSKLVARANMIFEMPKGFTELPIIKNRQMNYEYALKHPRARLELRYAVRPLDTLLKRYEERMNHKKPGDVYINPNNFYSTTFQATLANISTGDMPEMKEMDPSNVHKEFNADWGATAVINVNETFGQKYKYCLVVALHKDNAGDAYYFYLANKKQDLDHAVGPVFTSLKFKP